MVGAHFPHGLTVPEGILDVTVLNSRPLVAFWQGASSAGRIEAKKSLRGKDNKAVSRIVCKSPTAAVWVCTQGQREFINQLALFIGVAMKCLKFIA